MGFLRGLLLIAVLGVNAPHSFAAQAQDNIDDYVRHMKKDLNLTDEQSASIKKVFEEGVAKQKEIYTNAQTDDGTAPDQDSITRQLRKLKQDQMQQLAQILTPEQMRKWQEKQKLKSLLNRDKIDFSDSISEPATVTPNGANFNF